MNVRLVIADDDATIREALGDLLEAKGFEVLARAHDGAEAVDAAVEFRPDLMLVDIRMPRVNGIEAMQRITHRLPEIRLMALSAYDDPALAAAARDAGARDYLTKGTPPAELCARVRALAEA